MTGTRKYRDPEVLGDLMLKMSQKGRLPAKNASLLMGRDYTTIRTYIQKGYIIAQWIGGRQYIFETEMERFNEFGRRGVEDTRYEAIPIPIPIPDSKMPKGLTVDEPDSSLS